MSSNSPEPIEFRNLNETVGISESELIMEQRVQDIQDRKAPSLIWLLTHPHTLTAGTSAKQEDLINPNDIITHQSTRGGEWTYHGPGQRIAYTMIDMSVSRGTIKERDLRSLVTTLENWVIATLNEFNIQGFARPEFPGVWVNIAPNQPAKIAAIGLRIRRWVSFHGISINLNPDMDNYSRIKPCGLEDPVTSLHQLGIKISFKELDKALRDTAPAFFGSIVS